MDRVLGSDLWITADLTVSGQYTSTIMGEAAFNIADTVLNPNLNTDLLDGYHGTHYLDFANATNKHLVADQLLTGWTLGSNLAVSALDTIKGAFGKVQAQINALATSAHAALTLGTSNGLSLAAGQVLSLGLASAIATGALASADFNIFNNKQNALAGTGIVKSTGGTISYLTDNSANWNTAYSWGNHAGLYAPIAHVGAGGSAHSNATTSVSGFMSAADKVKLNDTTGGLGVNGFVPVWGSGGANFTYGSLLFDTVTNSLAVGGFSFDPFSALTVTGNTWVSGSVTSTRFISSVSTGTAPLTVSSTTLVPNLNVQFLNGQAGAYYLDWNNFTNKPTITSGTVTSVAMSVPTGLSVAGSPITSSGTLAVSFSAGYAIPTTAKQTQWDTAYSWGNHAGLYAPVAHVGTGGTAHANATTSVAGFMSASDKVKLDASVNYTHPTGDGNLHVPATSTTNNGRFLKAGATAGNITWSLIAQSDVTNLVTDLTAKQAILSGTGLVKSVAGTISYLTDSSANWNLAHSRWIGGSSPIADANIVGVADSGGVHSWGNTSTNTPVSGGYGAVLTFVGSSNTGNGSDSSGSFTNQIWASTGADIFFRQRVYNYGSYTAYQQFWTTKHFLASNVSNWNTAFGWGNHAGLYRPVSYVPAWADITGKPSTFAPASHTLDSHSNVTIASVATNQLIRWSGSTWVNWTPNFLVAADITGKENTITAGTTAQYWRGDKSWQTLNTAAVPELTNLYYTDSRARAAISGTGFISYNSTTGVISYTGGAGVGTVTSVGISVPTGLSVSGSPIIASGTIAISLTAGYSIPTTANQAIWTGKQDALSGSGLVKSTTGTISYITDNSTKWNKAYDRWAFGTGAYDNDVYPRETGARAYGTTTTGTTPGGFGTVLHFNGNTTTGDGDGIDWGNQIFISTGVDMFFRQRTYNYNPWSAIYQIWSSKQFTSTNIANWNTAHGWGNHTGLYVPLSGGTMTGDLLINDSKFRGASTGLVISKNGGTALVVVRPNGDANTTNQTAFNGTGPGITTTGGNSDQWNTAYSWGNHASAGYALSSSLSGYVPTSRTVTASTGLTGGGPLSSNISLAVAYGTTSTTATVGNDSRVLAGQNAYNRWISSDLPPLNGSSVPDLNLAVNTGLVISDGTVANNPGGYVTVLTLAGNSTNGDEQGGSWINQLGFNTAGDIYFRAKIYSYGTFTSWSQFWTTKQFTSANISNWNTAYGWGNHASAGYITAGSSNTLTNKSGNISMWTNNAGYITSSSLSGYATESWVYSNYNNGNTAYSWGNHASAGYVTASSSTNFTNKTGYISMWANDSGYITSVTASLGYTPLRDDKVITINGDTQYLNSNPNFTISGGVSGSGSNNYLAKWNGSSLASGSIYDPGSGTVSIYGTLDIASGGWLYVYRAQTNIVTANDWISVGTTSPSSSAILQLDSSTKGLLIPRMTYSQKIAMGSVPTSLMIYQTDTNGASVPGIKYWRGSFWTHLNYNDAAG